ncbi:MAG: hypothetical protein ACK42H_21475 [Planctomycetota bacterium]|jgi:hypothetical protein
MEEVFCSDLFSEGQLLGLELAAEIRAIVLQVPDRGNSRRRCQAGRCMFSSHDSHRFASTAGHMTIAKKSSNATSRSSRKADFQSASAEGPRTRRKNRLRIRKTLASIAQKRHDFGASRCSKRSLESCAEQNHLRENIGEIAKQQNRVQGDSDTHHIASL